MELPDYVKARKRSKDKVLREDYILDETLKSIGTGKKYFLKTYGCQMNEHDSENLKAMLEELNFIEVDDYNDADLVLLNTCSIRENAHNKAFGMLGRLKHVKESTNPNLIVGLCGCMAQEEGVVNELMHKYKWVNFVFGTHNIHRLPYILNEALDKNKQQIEVLSHEGNIIEGIPVKRASNYKAYVNIIYGCDKFCTYCIVPYTRGKQRSRNPKDIVREVEELVKSGYKEVTLLGQNVNAYGKDFDYDYTMENLLEDVSKTGIPRIFFMTSHPWDFTDGMIDVISKCDNVMPYVHLPVQSGSSRILKLMGRRYTKESYLELFDKIRERIPRVSISTDIIVGFPGEEEEDFLDTLELAEHCKYDNAFTFIYSPRENTAAAKLKDQVEESVKEERLQRLNTVVNKYFLENNKKLVGQVFPVLVEGISSKKNELFGYTDTFKLINFEGDSSLVGEIVNVKVVDAKTWSLDGEIVK
ncbi:MAG: tRNA (N6-isopentenyl adenosine(37)-C2)-methylthiotransferase MiaB [Bacilli bacterium]|nr:tRNA (N6-isopentenyl adenosine(37)-C2)-methylthiotransferase MiaB [Bacilli bacterium]